MRQSPIAAASVLRRQGREPSNGARRAIAPKPPRAAQLDYTAALTTLVEQVAELVRDTLFPVLKDFAKPEPEESEDKPKLDAADADLKALLRKLKEQGEDLALAPGLRKAIERAGDRVDAQSRRELARIGIRFSDVDPKLEAKVDTWRKANVEKVTSLATEQLPELEQILKDGDGVHVDSLKKKIEERLDVSKSSAERIARTQVMTLNAQVNQHRHEEAGVEEYIWTTSNDERVRGRPGGKWPNPKGSHWALEGKKFRWDDPPVAGPNGERAHPGEFYNCRCIAFPVLPELEEAGVDDGSKQESNEGFGDQELTTKRPSRLRPAASSSRPRPAALRPLTQEDMALSEDDVVPTVRSPQQKAGHAIPAQPEQSEWDKAFEGAPAPPQVSEAAVQKAARAAARTAKQEAARQKLVSIVEQKGGVLGANYSRDPLSFKSFDQTKLAFQGATKEQAQAIATGKAPPMRSVRIDPTATLTPVRVEIYRDKDGVEHTTLTDGRHRAHQAAEAGATHIKAIVSRTVGDKTTEKEMLLPLGKAQRTIAEIEQAKRDEEARHALEVRIRGEAAAREAQRLKDEARRREAEEAQRSRAAEEAARKAGARPPLPDVPFQQLLAAEDRKSGRVVIETTEPTIRRVFGRIPDPDELRSVVGANQITGANVKVVDRGQNSLAVHTTSPGVELSREFHRDPDGKLRVHHELFVLDDSAQGKGIGSKVLSEQFKNYERIGVQKVELDAAWVGRYTWARMGFQVTPEDLVELKSGLEQYLLRDGIPAASTIAGQIQSAQEIALLQIEGRRIGKDFLLSRSAPGLISMHVDVQPGDPAYESVLRYLKEK